MSSFPRAESELQLDGMLRSLSYQGEMSLIAADPTVPRVGSTPSLMDVLAESTAESAASPVKSPVNEPTKAAPRHPAAQSVVPVAIAVLAVALALASTDIANVHIELPPPMLLLELGSFI